MWNMLVVLDISPLFKEILVWVAVCVAFAQIHVSHVSQLPTCWTGNNLFNAQDLGCEGRMEHWTTAAWEGAAESVRKKQEALWTLSVVEGKASHALLQHLNRTDFKGGKRTEWGVYMAVLSKRTFLGGGSVGDWCSSCLARQGQKHASGYPASL